MCLESLSQCQVMCAVIPVYTMLFQQGNLCYKTKKSADFPVKDQDLLASHL